MPDLLRPLPQPTPLTAGFWEAAKRRELVIQRCESCETYRHYPQVMCPHCRSLEWEWSRVSGRGRIHSYTITHQAFHPAWADAVPYVVATIELDEGVRMVDDMLDLEPDQVEIGLPVQVYFEDVSEQIALPKFRVVR